MTYLQAVRRITPASATSGSISAQVSVLNPSSAGFAGVSCRGGSENPEMLQGLDARVSAGWGYKGATS